MVFESITNPIKAEKKPWNMVFIGVIFSSVAIIISLLVFGEHASLIAIFLTVMASVPLIYNTMKLEEKKDIEFNNQMFLLKEHGKALTFFMCLFFGFVISFSLWYVFLPNEFSMNLFEIQINEIQRIENVGVTGDAVSMIGILGSIFFNNIMVLLFSLLFAFFYGAGAIFILTWNASVIGAAVGNYIKANISLGYFSAVSLGLLRYSIHGIPEILAYFMAGLAGSIISIAVIRHDLRSRQFTTILTDSLNLIFISVLILFGAALLEVFVTPLFF